MFKAREDGAEGGAHTIIVLAAREELDGDIEDEDAEGWSEAHEYVADIASGFQPFSEGEVEVEVQRGDGVPGEVRVEGRPVQAL